MNERAQLFKSQRRNQMLGLKSFFRSYILQKNKTIASYYSFGVLEK